MATQPATTTTTTAAQSTTTTGAAELRRQLPGPGIVVAPGVYDGISARMAIKAGHTALYQTGAGTSASRLARADLGFLSMADIVSAAGVSIMASPASPSSTRRIVPVIADADVGFGGAPQVARTVQEYHRAGIAALHIEDQVASKRCGHLDSKQLVSKQDFIARIKAAKYAQDQLACAPADRILLIARTDALGVLGLDDALDRLRAARDAGAEMGFLEGIQTDQQARTAIEALGDWPLLANCVTGGKSPLWTATDVQRLGFRLAIFPCAGIFPAAKALLASYAHLADRGIGIEASTDPATSSVDLGGADPRGLRNFFADMGLDDEVAIDLLAAEGAGLGSV
ncbi:uncharacterized protein PFL1_05111 [Pseudozyma flocculosa PF-1]|uniref:Related to carboxyphosphonoenolpyruvate phosphonomutase n=2 Tax=Pseudozyma flocculosa TaxID=84751 RepID=A0A5C3F880_9BASI|nr:uncharacterized protein PFL1_05111 [Pseudozyma flocculosa PF-1]EPQ27188.1 hypothetical protein PFL1_05111 [Pseudozyma flocculosa PF-1]SPO39551.1 related to carboxyphosphonoenolpyruvate phosphonomutase [Pseudozyma flocculosa]